jgi:hypothetical protein
MAPPPLPTPLRALAAPLRRLHARLRGPRVARVGARPRWRFRRTILGGEGIRHLADLRGRALLIQFIGLG